MVPLLVGLYMRSLVDQHTPMSKQSKSHHRKTLNNTALIDLGPLDSSIMHHCTVQCGSCDQPETSP